MKNKNIIFNELKEICPLIVQINKINPYSLPAVYFSDLSNRIIEKIKFQSELDNASSLKMTFAVPKDYFENLPAQLLKKIYVNEEVSEVFKETELVAPLLNTISKNNLYSVPEGFFKEAHNLSAYKNPETKVVSINRRAKFTRLFAAAIVTSVLAAGLFYVTGKDAQNDTGENNNPLSDVRNLSKEEIVDFLKTSSSVENITSALQKSSNHENSIKSSLKKISDKEIQQFLKETGEADDI